jgi:aminobenzoyl-glutamate utilization protein B
VLLKNRNIRRGKMFKKFNYLMLVLLISLTEDIHTSSIEQSINKHKKQFSNVALEIWNHAEMGYQETKSSNLLASELEKEGFKITKNVANMPTAFIAEYGSRWSCNCNSRRV